MRNASVSQTQQFGWSPDQYALLDFGSGRKLERFGNIVLDRPCPAAEVCGRSTLGGTVDALEADRGEIVQRWSWERADLRLGEDGRLLAGQAPPHAWRCRYGAMVFQLKLTPFGHVGLFPEQAANWEWLIAHCAQYQQPTPRPFTALNLFAYTGGTTMCLASLGARVVHVDASAPAVKWARSNAQVAGLEQLPMRWIVDDARKFVARELRRGNRYDLIVLDPPSYGHGVGGARFAIAEDLPELLDSCLQLLEPAQGAVLLSAHCESPTAAMIAAWMRDSVGTGSLAHDRLQLQTQLGKSLDAGFFVRAVCSNR